MRTNSCVVFAGIVLPCGMHHRFAPVSECERMVERGECSRVHQPGKKSIGRTRPVYKLVPRPDPSNSQTTPSPITFEDILANVGLDAKPHRVRADRNIIKATRLKIANYRAVSQHDPYCVRG